MPKVSYIFRADHATVKQSQAGGHEQHKGSTLKWKFDLGVTINGISRCFKNKVVRKSRTKIT